MTMDDQLEHMAPAALIRVAKERTQNMHVKDAAVALAIPVGSVVAMRQGVWNPTARVLERMRQALLGRREAA